MTNHINKDGERRRRHNSINGIKMHHILSVLIFVFALLHLSACDVEEEGRPTYICGFLPYPLFQVSIFILVRKYTLTEREVTAEPQDFVTDS